MCEKYDETDFHRNRPNIMNKKDMTLTEILDKLPAEIGNYALTITKYFDPEQECKMWSMGYEDCDGFLLGGTDIINADFEDGVRDLYEWLCRDGHVYTEADQLLAHMMGDPVEYIDELIDSIKK